MQRFLFIINPLSGTKRKENLEEIIHQAFDGSKKKYAFAYTSHAKHAKEIASTAVDKGVDCIVAVGGDGTVNEVGAALINSQSVLGIVPTGSGNGLARSIGISLKPEKAIAQILKSEVISIDTLMIGEKPSLNMAGVGFDARVAHAFANYGKRGFFSYVWVSVKEFFRYRPIYVRISINNQEISEEAFVVSFANSGQYGNNAYIAPKASVSDGLFDVIVIKSFQFRSLPSIVFDLFTKRLDENKYVTSYKTSEISINECSSSEFHIDGEPIVLDELLKLQVNSKSLRIIIGKEFSSI